MNYEKIQLSVDLSHIVFSTYCFFMIILCIILLHNEKAHATQAETGTITNTKLETDKFPEVLVVPMKTNVSIDSNTDVRVL